MIWNRDDSKSACAEGWDLFSVSGGRDDGLLMIQRLDDPGCDEGVVLEPVFDGDDAAIAFVKGKAEAGSALHRRAMALHGTEAE